MTSATSGESDAARPTRRRERGRQRMEQIVNAAVEVFGEQGYDAATTNAIAQRAGISPGSLYQFFSNKDDIARAVAEHYAERLGLLAEEAFGDPPERGADALEPLVGGLLDQLVEFNVQNPGFKALFSRTDMPANLREAVAPMQQIVHTRVRLLVATVLGLREDEADLTASVAVQIVRGTMPLVVAAPLGQREILVAELRLALVSYLRQHAA